MTDETDQQRTDERGPATIRFRRGDGEWRELTTKRRTTCDPELDAIWEMTIPELEEILNDESHPLHEKAQQVSAEMMKPFIEMMRPTREAIAQSVKGLRDLMPVIDTSWVNFERHEMPKFGLHPAAKWLDPPRALARPTAVASLIDFDAIDPPDASLAEIRDAAEARAHEMRSQQVDVLTELLSEARAGGESGKEAVAISQRALEETKSSRRAAWIAAWVAIAASVISVVGIVVTTW